VGNASIQETEGRAMLMRRATAFIAMLLPCLPITAQAADAILTLLCQGTVISQSEEKPEQLSMGVIINFTAQTVQGFGSSAQITTVDDVTIAFVRPNSPTIEGTIDRVTGTLEATFTMFSSNGKKILLAQRYMLKCMPAQRMF
jgi:hypothetical protein